MLKIEKTPTIQTFLDIVQIDSPTGHEEKMTKHVSDQLISYGLEPHTDNEGNVHVFLSGNPELEPIFLNAHLDTVEPGRGIKPQIDSDGWIRSDGTTILGADNKSAVAAILSSLPDIIALKNNHHPLDIFFTVSEEGNSHGAIGFDYSRLHAKNGYAFDVDGEEFGTVIASAPFYNRLKINLEGKSGHAKNPENAANVLPIFIESMSQLPLGRFSPNTLVNIGKVNCGTATNTIPGSITIEGEVRSILESELEEITSKYREIFTKNTEGGDITLKFEAIRENPGYKVEADNKFLKDTLKKLKEFGINAEVKDSFGCADANYFASHGLTTLDIADGSAGAHTTKERTKVTNLEKLTKLIIFLVSH